MSLLLHSLNLLLWLEDNTLYLKYTFKILQSQDSETFFVCIEIIIRKIGKVDSILRLLTNQFVRSLSWYVSIIEIYLSLCYAYRESVVLW